MSTWYTFVSSTSFFATDESVLFLPAGIGVLEFAVPAARDGEELTARGRCAERLTLKGAVHVPVGLVGGVQIVILQVHVGLETI